MDTLPITLAVYEVSIFIDCKYVAEIRRNFVFCEKRVGTFRILASSVFILKIFTTSNRANPSLVLGYGRTASILLGD